MHVEVGTALAPAASPGISRDELDRLDEQVGAAHQRMMTGREHGTDGYAALALPERTNLDAITRAVDGLPAASSVLLVGIGGSALGARTLVDALGSGEQLYVLDNIDPEHTAATLSTLDFDDLVVHVVSRSGRTMETLTNTAIVVDAMMEGGVDPWSRMLVTTGDNGPLRQLATEHDVAVLDVPDGVPGRYAALSEVGLPAPALLGHDIEAILAGGRDATARFGPSLFECPSYAFGAVSYALAKRGATVHAMMPYAERLESFAEWFAQLWAESLGKDNHGQVPARALGVTDQHSQLQLYRAGIRSVLVTFLQIAERTPVAVPQNGLPDSEATAGRSLGSLMDVALDATQGSLVEAGRPSLRVTIDSLDERSLGNLLVSMEAACILYGELLEINPFDQPAVEWSKVAIDRLLRGDERELETLSEAPSLSVG